MSGEIIFLLGYAVFLFLLYLGYKKCGVEKGMLLILTIIFLFAILAVKLGEEKFSFVIAILFTPFLAFYVGGVFWKYITEITKEKEKREENSRKD